MTTPAENGYEAYQVHKRSRIFGGVAPAETLRGEDAVRFYLPPEPQTLVQMALPRGEPWRSWIADWDRAREEDPLR